METSVVVIVGTLTWILSAEDYIAMEIESRFQLWSERHSRAEHNMGACTC